MRFATSRMRVARGFVFFVSVAAAVVGGGVACNAILGNEPGLLERLDASDDDAPVSSDAGCGIGSKQCVGICVSVQDAAVGCSGDCTACPALANASSTCRLENDSYVCALGDCSPPFKDCDNNGSNGCETPVTTKNNCGNCNNPCNPLPFCVVPTDGGTAACSASCPGAPYQDCCASGPCATSSDPTGECVNLQKDPTNCGACGKSCATQFPHAITDCNAGACEIVSCSAGYDLCGGQCVLESDTSCGTSCVNCTQLPSTPVCQSGSCVSCPGSQVYCGPGSGCHDEDQNHCGPSCTDCGGGTCDLGTHTCTGGTSCTAPSIACTASCCGGACIDPSNPKTCGADGTMTCGTSCDPTDAGYRCCTGAVGALVISPPPGGVTAGGYHCGKTPNTCP